jgi:hypothetical protein
MRRLILVFLFAVVALSLVGGLHLYLVDRLIDGSGLTGSPRTLALVALCLLAASLVLAPIAERLAPLRLARLVAWPAALWMGFAFLLLTLVAVSDLLQWLAGGAAMAERVSDPSVALSAAPGRALAVMGLASLLGAVALRSGLRAPALRRVEITLTRWPRALDGYRIV